MSFVLACSAIVGATPTFTSAQVLEEVVVMARKTSESVQDIPGAVTGFSNEALGQFGFDNPNQIVAQVPNFQASGVYGDVQPIFSLRGISMSDFNSHVSSPIGVYVDEAYQWATYTHGANFFDVQSIEVLRGPQGTLWGRNTTGGAVSIMTKTPDLDAPTSGEIRGGFGAFDMRSAFVAAESVLIDDKLAIRGALNFKEDDGFLEILNGGPNGAQTKYLNGRVTLNYQATDRLNAVLKYNRMDSDPRGFPNKWQPNSPGGTDALGVYRLPPNADFYSTSTDVLGVNAVETDQVIGRLTYELEDYDIVSVTAWSESDFEITPDRDGTDLINAHLFGFFESDAVSQDIRLQSKYDGPFNFIVGAYYGDEDTVNRNIYDLGLTADSQIVVKTDWETEKTTYAIYGQFGYDFSDKLTLDVGLRYTHDVLHVVYQSTQFLDSVGDPEPPSNGGPCNTQIVPLRDECTDESGITPENTDEEITGQVTLSYNFSDSAMAYASFSRGYRGSEFLGAIQFFGPLPADEIIANPEFVDVFEVGSKLELMDNRLRVNTAAFYYEYTDQQFIDILGFNSVLRNAGQSEIWGFEAEVQAAFTDSLTGNLGVGWLDTEFVELDLDGVDLSGNELISAPQWNISFALDQNISTNWGAVILHLDGTFVDDQFFSAQNDAVLPNANASSEFNDYGDIAQDSYFVLNGRVTALFGDNQDFTISAFVKNMLEEEYHVYGILLPAAGLDYLMPGRPREWGFEFSYLF